MTFTASVPEALYQGNEDHFILLSTVMNNNEEMIKLHVQDLSSVKLFKNYKENIQDRKVATAEKVITALPYKSYIKEEGYYVILTYSANQLANYMKEKLVTTSFIPFFPMLKLRIGNIQISKVKQSIEVT